MQQQSTLTNSECHWLNNTYIEAEHLAYNTSNGGHSKSNRHGMVRCADGVIRSVTLGVPDTYFTIPAHLRINNKYVSGFVTVDTDNEEYLFVAHPN